MTTRLFGNVTYVNGFYSHILLKGNEVVNLGHKMAEELF